MALPAGEYYFRAMDFLDPKPSRRLSGRYDRGYLPHLRAQGGSYFVTFRLEGTLPQEVLRQYQAERNALFEKVRRSGGELSPEDQQRLFELYSEKIEAQRRSHRNGPGPARQTGPPREHGRRPRSLGEGNGGWHQGRGAVQSRRERSHRHCKVGRPWTQRQANRSRSMAAKGPGRIRRAVSSDGRAPRCRASAPSPGAYAITCDRFVAQLDTLPERRPPERRHSW